MTLKQRGIMWRDITIDPPNHDSPDFVALGNTEISLVWWEPEAGMRWKVMNLPGRAIRLGDNLSETFHSWCPVGDFHRALNHERNPAYYGLIQKS